MPENPTTVPTAGWYTDPSNPSLERWWGGVEWTHDVRPIAPAAPPTQPVFAQQSLYTSPQPAYVPPAQYSAHAAVPSQPEAVAQPTVTPPPAEAYAPPAPQGFAPPAPQGFAAPAAATPIPDAPAAPAAAPFAAYQGLPQIAQPVSLADVPGGGINPFAAIDAQERQNADPFASPFSAPAAPAPSFNGFDSFDPFANGAAPAPTSTGVNASWYDASRRAAPRPEPTNGFATAGLVLSLVGVNLLGIIFSIIGLRRARGFEADGDLPVGRKRSRWGLGLGITSAILSIGLTFAFLYAGTYFMTLYSQMSGTSAQKQDQGGIVLDPNAAPPVASDPANDGSYNRATYEQGIRDEYAADGLPAPDSVVCPDAGATSEGSTIVCTIVTGSVTETRTAEYFANGGYSISTTSASQ